MKPIMEMIEKRIANETSLEEPTDLEFVSYLTLLKALRECVQALEIVAGKHGGFIAGEYQREPYKDMTEMQIAQVAIQTATALLEANHG